MAQKTQEGKSKEIKELLQNENMNLTKVIVPCRFSYLHCWEPNAVNDGDPNFCGCGF